MSNKKKKEFHSVHMMQCYLLQIVGKDFNIYINIFCFPKVTYGLDAFTVAKWPEEKDRKLRLGLQPRVRPEVVGPKVLRLETEV